MRQFDDLIDGQIGGGRIGGKVNDGSRLGSEGRLQMPRIHTIGQTDGYDPGSRQPNHELVEVDLHPLDDDLVLHPGSAGQLMDSRVA